MQKWSNSAIFQNEQKFASGKFCCFCFDLTNDFSNRLQCKSFSWFLENVYPELRIPNKDAIGWGAVSQTNNGLEECIGTDFNKQYFLIRSYLPQKKYLPALPKLSVLKMRNPEKTH